MIEQLKQGRGSIFPHGPFKMVVVAISVRYKGVMETSMLIPVSRHAITCKDPRYLCEDALYCQMPISVQVVRDLHLCKPFPAYFFVILW